MRGPSTRPPSQLWLLPKRILCGLPVSVRPSALSGWTQIESADIDDLIARWNHLPLAGVILTSTERDGTMSGPDLEVLKRVRALSRLPIQYSGGVSSLEDVRQVREADAAAVILGRSLYEGKISLEEALAL